MNDYFIDKEKLKPMWSNIVKKSRKKNKKVFLLNTPYYYNLGDHAICLGELAFLKKFLPNHEVIQISDEIFDIYFDKLKDIIGNSTIFFTGGGNLGTLWFFVEERLRKTIINFPNNKIICFPNTIFYENSELGQLELLKSKQIYSKHSDLHIFLREKISYEFIHKHLPALKIYFAPDMSFFMPSNLNNIKTTKGILFVLRKDKEQTINNLFKKSILNYVEELNYEYDITDTVIENEKIYYNKKSQTLILNKLEEFCQYKLIITDRLHGFIFATMLGIPCILINSLSHKSKGVFDYLNTLSHKINIKLVNNFNEFKKVFTKMLQLENYTKIELNHIKSDYSQLIKLTIESDI